MHILLFFAFVFSCANAKSKCVREMVIQLICAYIERLNKTLFVVQKNKLDLQTSELEFMESGKEEK